MKTFTYWTADDFEAASRALAGAGPRGVAKAGGTDLLTLLKSRVLEPDEVVNLQRARRDGANGELSALATLAEVAEDAWIRERFPAVARAALEAATPQVRNAATVGGNLCQHTRCWYYRGVEWHCWLGGGDTCYAQIGDHRKHGLEPGDCISAHPSDLAPALAACGATVAVRSSAGERELPLLELYRRPTEDNRSLLSIAPGELGPRAERYRRQPRPILLRRHRKPLHQAPSRRSKSNSRRPWNRRLLPALKQRLGPPRKESQSPRKTLRLQSRQ